MKKPLTERQLANLRAHAFPKGISGCPGGRSPQRMLTLALRAKLASCVPGERRTVAEKLAAVLVDLAIGGDISAFELIANRTEGSVPQRVNAGVSFSTSGQTWTLDSFRGMDDEELSRQIREAEEVIAQSRKRRPRPPEKVQ